VGLSPGFGLRKLLLFRRSDAAPKSQPGIICCLLAQRASWPDKCHVCRIRSQGGIISQCQWLSCPAIVGAEYMLRARSRWWSVGGWASYLQAPSRPNQAASGTYIVLRTRLKHFGGSIASQSRPLYRLPFSPPDLVCHLLPRFETRTTESFPEIASPSSSAIPILVVGPASPQPRLRKERPAPRSS
jgi:hypothetical protein